MKHRQPQTIGRVIQDFLILLGLMGGVGAFAGDNGALVSMSVLSNTSVTPRSIFTQTWTIQNTGTTTWTAGQSGYTLNLISWDRLGAIQNYANTSGSRYIISALIGSGKSISPGGTATFSLMFIAPEAAGSYTDVFQLNNASSAYFGPQFVVQVVVPNTGNTNQFDRCRAVSYANNYAGWICSDGYFWTNGSYYYDYGTNVHTPTNLLGDDCAHFVSCCIGREPHQWGAGLYIPSRAAPTYGEPAASRIVNTCLIAPGYAVEVTNLNQMSAGDVVGWNWEGDTNIANLDHVTLYLGNGLLASHAASALDVSANTFFQSGEPSYVRHLVHIFDAPTVNYTRSGAHMVMSWGTNWAGYVLQSSPALGQKAVWNNVTTTPTKVGALNVLTNTMGSGNLFYRLELPVAH